MPLPAPTMVTGFATLTMDTSAHWLASTNPIPANLMAVSQDTGVPRLRIGTGTARYVDLKEYILVSQDDTIVLDGGDASTA